MGLTCGTSALSNAKPRVQQIDLMIQPSVTHYYINLDRSPDRRAHMESHLGAHNLAMERIAGIDGHALSDNTPGVDRALYRRCHGRNIRPGEIGCYLSHLRALEVFLQ